MIQLIVLGLTLVAAGVLVLIVERLLARREAQRRVNAELRRAAEYMQFWNAQERRVQAMFAARSGGQHPVGPFLPPTTPTVPPPPPPSPRGLS